MLLASPECFYFFISKRPGDIAVRGRGTTWNLCIKRWRDADVVSSITGGSFFSFFPSFFFFFPSFSLGRSYVKYGVFWLFSLLPTSMRARRCRSNSPERWLADWLTDILPALPCPACLPCIRDEPFICLLALREKKEKKRKKRKERKKTENVTTVTRHVALCIRTDPATFPTTDSNDNGRARARGE